MRSLYTLILAAGKGTRMASRRAKVLHEVCGEPMLKMVYRAALGLQPQDVFIVIGQDADLVQACMEGNPATFVMQEKQMGTGHAVLSAKDLLSRRKGDLLVLSGDTPRIKSGTLQKLLQRHRETEASTTILTTRPPNPHGYGRVLRGPDGTVAEIVEEKDATPEQKEITEINTAFYCFDIPLLLDALARISTDNAQKEYYLTDVIGIQKRDGRRIEALLHPDFDELQGINNREELSRISGCLWREKCSSLMTAGVTIMDPAQTYVDSGVIVGKDTILYPQVHLEGNTIVGEGTVIHSHVRIRNSSIGDEVQVLDSSLICDSRVRNGAVVGPFGHLRDNADIGPGCRIGNFVEVKKSSLGPGSCACHLSYLGDAIIGSGVTIGAGTITCNFDGVAKNATIIEDGAFIGSDCQLIAPVRIGRNAAIAAGSCITQDVPPEALGIARERQVNKVEWRNRRRRNGSPAE
jgi:bifunctional UDP-N-acetylglucosamine pyrophosphorylase / glucosamine-1-phosphate N-acetyltransferase